MTKEFYSFHQEYKVQINVDSEIAKAYRRIVGDPPQPEPINRLPSYFELWLRDKMRRAKLTHESLATAVGVDVDTVRAWADGRAVPRDALRPTLYQPLGVTIEDFARAAAVPK